MQILEILWRDWWFLIVIMGVGLLSMALNRSEPAHVAEIERFAVEQGLRLVKVERLPYRSPVVPFFAPMSSAYYLMIVADPDGKRRRLDVALHKPPRPTGVTVLKSRAL